MRLLRWMSAGFRRNRDWWEGYSVAVGVYCLGRFVTNLYESHGLFGEFTSWVDWTTRMALVVPCFAYIVWSGRVISQDDTGSGAHRA